MSIRFTRTAKISRGRFMEAIAWAKETAGYVEKKYGLPKVGVWVDAFGDINTIRWTVDYADLAAVDKASAQMMADADYWKLVERASKNELFIDGSVHDTVSRAV